MDQADLLLILGDTDGVLVKSAQESSSVVGCYLEDAQYQVVGGCHPQHPQPHGNLITDVLSGVEWH